MLPSSKYPYESGRRIGIAVFEEIAESNLDTVTSFGRAGAKNFLKIYKTVVMEGDPAASIRKLSVLNRTFTDLEAELTVVDQSAGSLKCKFTFPSFETEDVFMQAYAHILIGTLEEITEQAGGKNVSVSLEKGAEEYIFSVKWD